MKTLRLPEVLAEAGIVVKVLPGWTTAHSGGSYKWRETPENPAGAIDHHTATSAYTPNRDKASGYLGMGDPSLDNPRLYQVGGSGRVPIYTIANAHPAPISSGYGVRAVLDLYVKKDIPFVGKQTQPDDSPQWAGNTHYWNTEVVLDGTGTAMPDEMWETLILFHVAMNDLFGWTPARIIGHGQHTKRKIDLRDGRFPDMATTIDAIRLAVGDSDMSCPWNPNAAPGSAWYTTYPKCGAHYEAGAGAIKWGENTGMCAVPSWGEAAVDWGVATGRVNVRDNNRDDFTRNLDDGRYLVYEHRAS